MSQERSLMEEFLVETREHLNHIEDEFLLLEKQNDKNDNELINKIFRAIHTIKGSAGFLGLKNIGLLSHEMETILSAIREGIIQPIRKIIDTLLDAVDKLNSLLDDVEHSNDKDISEIMAKLDKINSVDSNDVNKEDIKKSITLRDHSGKQVGFEVREISLRMIPPGQHFLYLLDYDLTQFETVHGKSPLDIMRSLRQTGEIIDGILEPPAGDLSSAKPGGPLSYRLLYSTVIDNTLIADVVELNNSSIVQIDRNLLLKKNMEIKNKSVTSSSLQQKQEDTQIPEFFEPKEIPGNTAKNETIKTSEDPLLKSNDTLRIRLEVLDELMMLAGELVLVRNQQLMNIDREDAASRTITQRLDIVTSSLQESIMRTRMQPIGSIFNKFTRIARDLGQKLGKTIELSMTGNEVELDKTILETLTDPLTHLIRNCCDHGIETPVERSTAGKSEAGHINLRAYHEGGQMNIEIFDDGKGIDTVIVKKKALEKKIKTAEELDRMGEKELLSLIFLPGFSTAEKVSDLSGRGVGMDVVKTAIEKLNGIIDIKTFKGKGTQIYLRLPLTLAIIPSLIVISGKNRYAIPQINLEELVCLYDEQIQAKIEYAGNREVYRLRNLLLPIVSVEEILNRSTTWSDTDKSVMAESHRINREKNHQEFLNAKSDGKTAGISLTFAVLKAGNTRFGLVINSVVGTEEIVVKPMHRLLKKIPIYSGSTVLGDGKVALILDSLGIARHAGIEFEEQETTDAVLKKDSEISSSYNLLLFKSGEEEQYAFDLTSVKRIERISVNDLERVGNREFITIDGRSTIIVRLESILNVTPCKKLDEMFLLLPKKGDKPCGILASQLVDIGSFNIDIDLASVKAQGFKGSAIVKDRMSLMLDMDQILELALAG
jgi:two-component system, chemotaxis family, sensor kinase CheA